MSVRIVRRGDNWVIPCREFAAVQLDKPIRYRYRTRGNAVRAVLNSKYNMTTLLCHNIEELYTRLTYAENLLWKIKRIADQPSANVWGLVGDCFQIESDSQFSGGGNSDSGQGTGGSSSRDSSAEGGCEGADAGVNSTSSRGEGTDGFA